MAVQEVTMYRVTCDRCGAGADEDTDFYAWTDAGQAVDVATNADWLTEGGQWCPRCVIYDEDHDEYKPNPEPVEAASVPA